MRVLVLDLHLFPDRATIEAAVARLADDHAIERLAPTAETGAVEWDHVLAMIRASDVIVTL